MGSFQLYFEMIGAVAFAMSGAALGIRKGMDLFGVAMMGMTTAVGGGILRDVMLGQTPPAACCGMCAAWSGPTSSPSTYTPARRWWGRRCAAPCGRLAWGLRCWRGAA